MSATTDAVASAAKGQHEATAEIARSVQSVTGRVDGMSRGIATVSTVAVDTRALAGEVARDVARVETSASGLNDATASLIAQLRAA
jgi:methyl-accepting chemotaxis protein